MTPRQVTRRLLAMLRPMRGLVVGSVVCRIVNQGLGVAIPVIAVGAVVRIAAGDGPEPVPLSLLLAAIAVVKGLFRYLEQFTGHAVAFRLLATLRADTFRSLAPLAPAGLEDDRSGDLVTRVIGDVDRVEPFFAHTVAPLSAAVVVPALTVVALGITTTWSVALTLVPFLIALLAVPWLRRRRVAALAPELRTAAGRTAATLADAGQGVREIVVFAARDRIIDELDRTEAPVAAGRRRLAGIAALRGGMADLVAAGAVVAVAAATAAAMTNGELALDGLAMAVTAAWVVATPARAIEEIVPDLEGALAAGARLFELADRTPPIPEPAADGPVPTDSSFAFDGVTVRHDGDRPALDSLTAAITAGGLVGLVGPSGSGKSTLVDLLLRFRLADQGTVSIGGAEISAIPTGALRRHVAVVAQRPEIFHGTVAGNLRLADPAATDLQLWAVLERVGLADWVRSVGRDLDLHVGELGDQISGGQRQRLALARALLRNAPLLVLDEATSELDADAERRVMQAVTEQTRTGTVLFVAHRLGPIAGADRILVLDEGRLVEEGRHEELLAADRLYAGLWRRHLDTIETPPGP